jgi:hypothetical protein
VSLRTSYEWLHIPSRLMFTLFQMRPPYGDIDDRVRAISLAMGLTPVMWTRISPMATFDTGGRSITSQPSFSYVIPLFRLHRQCWTDDSSASLGKLGLHSWQRHSNQYRIHCFRARSIPANGWDCNRLYPSRRSGLFPEAHHWARNTVPQQTYAGRIHWN